MDKKVILVCQKNHHWIDDTICPFCGLEPIEELPFQSGDCIKCGSLCPGYAYGCTSPEPIQNER